MYSLNKCPVCGGFLIKKIDIQKINNDELIIYKCESCDSIISNNTQMEKDEIARIATEERKRLSDMLINKEMLGQEIYEKAIRSIIEIRVDNGQHFSLGTGVVLKEGIVTNAHVLTNDSGSIKHLKRLSIKGHDSKHKAAVELSVLKINKEYDLALLKYDAQFIPLEPSKYEIKNGERVYVVGNPLGQGLSIVDGIISDSNRILNGREWIMFSGQINSGNSGGALLSARGELLGIVTLTRTDAVGMNYAIPMNVVNKYLIDE